MPAPSYRAVLNAHAGATPEVQQYFDQLPDLVRDFPWEVSLAYMFIRLETAHNMALYCGVVKLHRASTTIARNVVNAHHLTRDGFLKLFNNVFGLSIDDSIVQRIKRAEKIRDKVVHGKATTPSEMRNAVVDILEYARELNTFLHSKVGFKPFNQLRGFKGRAQPLDTKTTRWLMKGLGFNAQ